MAEKTTYLITGSNRGLGRGLVETLLLRPNTRVIAAVRNPLDPNSQTLKSLPTAPGSNIIIVQIDSSSETDAFEAIRALRTDHGVTSLDVVIANAGTSKFRGTALDTPVHEMKDHLMVNALGPLLLYQATKSLLDASSLLPKFIVVSSVVSSITDVGKFPLPNTAYGTSKAALNFIIRKIHYENPKLIAFPIHPGWVQTDMGNAAAARSGMKEAPVSLESSVRGILREIDHATKTEHNRFILFDGTDANW